MRSHLSAPIIASLCLSLILSATASGAAAETGQLVEQDEAASSSILKSDRTNGGPFHRSQSKRASATLAKSLPLISATTQIAKAKDEQTATPATATTTTTMESQTTMEFAMHTNSSLSVASTAKATATAFPNPNPITIDSHSSINNISNNGDQQQQQQQQRNPFTMATSVPRVTSVLQANLVMSNRNVEEQELDEHKYKITQYNVLFPHSNTNSFTNDTTTAATPPPPTATTTSTSATEESTTTKATTTTRRPAPRTTLRPPPTIDDYQTIISQAGTHAYLPCNVKQLVKKPISWLRMRDGHILTVDQTTFIADQRFQSVFSPHPERWSLQIKYVQLKDEGTYECQVSTEPKASAIVHLRIVEPKTELIGESTRHVKAGSQVKLRCIISQALEPPLFINWFYNQKQIYLHNRRGWRTEIERIDLPTEASTTTPAATSTAAERLNDIAATTYILDAITVSDGAVNSGYGYAMPTTTTMTTTTTTATTTTPTTATMSLTMMTAGAGAGEVVFGATAADTPATLTSTTAAAAAGAATMTTAIADETTTATATTKTTTKTEPSTTAATTTTTTASTTTTMLPSSSFIKQITRASLIIPAVVKLDSGNYTCSPSNSAPRTIVLHVLNGEYSASAIKSASVSWNTLIGCPGYLHWRNISTILTLLWIIKFVLARNVTICCNHGRNKVNNPALQESTTITTTAASKTKVSVGESVSRRLCTQTQTETATRRQWRLGFDCGGECGNVSSSISGTKVAEDKT